MDGTSVVRNVIKNWVVPGIAFLLVLAAVQAFFNSGLAVADGDSAPGFTLLDTEGQEVSLSAHRGARVVVNFWGTWCPPCLKELPGLSDFARSNSEVVVLGIAVPGDERQSLAELARAKERLDIPFQVLAADGLVQAAYGVKRLPTTFLIDDEGVVERHLVGVLTPERLAMWLR